MSKQYKLVDVTMPVPTKQLPPLDWELCVLCQDDTPEPLQCPASSKRTDTGAGYKSLTANLVQFNELGEFAQCVDLRRLDEGQGILATLTVHRAKLHKSCKDKYNNTKLQRALKRRHSKDGPVPSTSAEVSKRTRSNIACVDIENDDTCFFCHQELDSEYRQAETLELDKRVRKAAECLGDTTLLAQLSTGDMVAREAKYHAKCLVALYNRVRAAQKDAAQEQTSSDVISAIVLAELVTYIEETVNEEDVAHVFKMADLTKLYNARMEQLGVQTDQRVHTTRLKDRILAHFLDLREHKKGRDILLVFEDDIGNALAKACEHDIDNDAVHLARAARIVRKGLFSECQPFNVPFLTHAKKMLCQSYC